MGPYFVVNEQEGRKLYVRRGEGDNRISTFGPKPADHPSVGDVCPRCTLAFVAGDHTAVIATEVLDKDELTKRLGKQPYNSLGEEIHLACVAMDDGVLALASGEAETV